MIIALSAISISRHVQNAPSVTLSLKGHQMLVMSRKPQQSFTIKVPPQVEPSTIVVKIISNSKSQTRVGVEASDEVVILRTEVLDKDLADAKVLSK